VPRALIALGSNLGDRAANLLAALAALNESADIELEDSSAFHEFPAVRVGEAEPGGAYLNAAAVVSTELEPEPLLGRLHAIEARLGRDRRVMPHGAARVIDLDLILDDRLVTSTSRLTLPHPAMHERLFVLRPAAEVAGEWVVPTQGKSVRQLLARVESGA
jgi:2-amino-4-hydroxy-6-hydroxymethyldihydropteridine diphosphokinase